MSGYGDTSGIDDFKDIPYSVDDNKEDLESLYFYFSNIPASDKEPFEFILEGQKIFTTNQTIPPTEVIIVDAAVNVSEFREIGQIVLQTVIKVPACKVYHMQQFDVSKSGEYIMIGMDPVKKVISISQSHNEYKLKTNQKLNTSYGQGPKPEIERKKISRVNLKMNKLPADAENPFKIFMDNKLIYQFNKPLTLETEIAVNLPWPQDTLLVTCTFNGTQKVEKKLMMEDGDWIQITGVSRQVQINQNETGNFEKPKLPLVPVQFYVLNCKVLDERPFELGTNDSIFYETTELKQLKGIKYEFDAPEDHGDMILNLEVIHPSQGIIEELEFNLTKSGTHILLEFIELGVMKFWQRKSEFQFTQNKEGMMILKDDGKSLAVLPLEQTEDEVPEDDAQNGLKQSAMFQIENLLEIGVIDEKEFARRKFEIDQQYQ